MKKRRSQPSKIAMAFFQWYCRAELREEIEGDLLEQFHANTEKYGHAKANHLFMKEVVLLFRPKIIGSIYQLTNTKTMVITKQNKRLAMIVVLATALLLIPLIAMNFSSEVNWKIMDFLVAGILLIGAGLILELMLRVVKSKRNRWLLAVVLFLTLILIWAELAVGIFGTFLAGS